MPSAMETGRKRSRDEEEHIIHPDFFVPPKRSTPPVRSLSGKTMQVVSDAHLTCDLDGGTEQGFQKTTGNTHDPCHLVDSTEDQEFERIIIRGATHDPCDLTNSTEELGLNMGAFCDNPYDLSDSNSAELPRIVGTAWHPCALTDSTEELGRTMASTRDPCDLANSIRELEQTMGTATHDPCELTESAGQLGRTMGATCHDPCDPCDLPASSFRELDHADSAEDAASTSHPHPASDRDDDDDGHSSASTSWDEKCLTLGQPLVDLDLNYLLQASDYELGIPSSQDRWVPEDMTWLDSVCAEMHRDQLEQIWAVHVDDDDNNNAFL